MLHPIRRTIHLLVCKASDNRICVLSQDGGPPPGEPLVLWQPPEGEAGPMVDVDPMLTRWLRPHQREGVQFMFDCVCGLRSKAGQGGSLLLHA